MANTLHELKLLVESIFEKGGAPVNLQVELLQNKPELGETFPVPISREIRIFAGLMHLRTEAIDVPDASLYCEARFLNRPHSVQIAVIVECFKSFLHDEVCSFNERGIRVLDAVPASWDSYSLSKVIASPPSYPYLVFPAGSFARVCTSCKKVELFDICSVAFSSDKPSWQASHNCLRCGGDSFMAGITKTETYIRSEDHVMVHPDIHITPDNFDKSWCKLMDDLTDAVNNHLIRYNPQEMALMLWKARGGMDFEEALAFLVNHPLFKGRFFECVEFLPVKTCLRTRRVEGTDSPFENDSWEVWIEAGDFVETAEGDQMHRHMGFLDCSGWSIPESIVHLAHNVKHYFKDNGQQKSLHPTFLVI